MMVENNDWKDPSADMSIERRLREAGLRATRPRILVYRTLSEIGGHLSVDQVVAALRDRGEDIPRMSVYNVVADLEATGLVMCADTGPGRALYEVSNVWHHHFVCRVCKTVTDVPCWYGEKLCLEPPSSLPGTIDETQVIFRGVCEECATRGANDREGTTQV